MSEYRYESRRDAEVIATGHVGREQPLELGERITIGSHSGIMRTTEPQLGAHALHLVAAARQFDGRPNERARAAPVRLLPEVARRW
jgi:hypothetical protein